MNNLESLNFITSCLGNNSSILPIKSNKGLIINELCVKIGEAATFYKKELDSSVETYHPNAIVRWFFRIIKEFSPGLYNICLKIFKFFDRELPIEKFALQLMREAFSAGHCYGSSMALLRARLKNQTGYKINKNDALVFQGINRLEVQLVNIVFNLVSINNFRILVGQNGGDLKKLLSLRHKAHLLETELRKLSFMEEQIFDLKAILSEVPEEYINLLLEDEEAFFEKKAGAQRLLAELKDEKSRLLGDNLEEVVEKTHVQLGDSEKIAEKFREFFNAGSQRFSCSVLGLSPPDGGVGHALFVDFENCIFYDTNFGFYYFENRDQLESALFKHISRSSLFVSYREYLQNGSSWTFESYTKNALTYI